MKILVTAGSTSTMIDKVRCITNIFKGRTGHVIASYFREMGHEVVLITSNIKHADSFGRLRNGSAIEFKTYDELYSAMKNEIKDDKYDVVIHSAAVSDYRVIGTYVELVGPCEKCALSRDNCVCDEHDDFGKEENKIFSGHLVELDSSGKVGSEHDSLYLKLEKTEKIVDRIRDTWGFKGKLVKFKLQVDMSDEELIKIATDSMIHSNADVMVANCLEWSTERAYIIQKGKSPESVKRSDLSLEIEKALGY